MERNRKIFENYSAEVEEISWERIRPSLWGSLSPTYRDLSFSVILLDLGVSCGIVFNVVLQCRRYILDLFVRAVSF